MGEMKISRFTDSTEISYKKNMHNWCCDHFRSGLMKHVCQTFSRSQNKCRECVPLGGVNDFVKKIEQDLIINHFR